MKKILLIGAGRSASTLIQYLLEQAAKEDWFVTVADMDYHTAGEKVAGNDRGKPLQFDVFNEKQRAREVEEADLVISLLPPHLHVIVARDCLRFNTNLVTASYVSDEMRELDQEAKDKGLIFLNEIGVDPGIDHMSAMEVIDRIRDEGGELTAFRSNCGAMIAPESNDNPWGYKFTWSPRNVVLAGQAAAARYLKNRKIRYIPYNRLFTEVEKVVVPGTGEFEAYCNRDSLPYREPYHLQDIPTIIRGTLRYPGYCEAWNALIEIGLTYDHYVVEDIKGMTYRDWVFCYIDEIPGKTDRQSLADFLGEAEDSELMDRLMWTGLLSDEQIPLEEGTPAQILQDLLERKWLFREHDVDMVVMQHQFDFEMNGKHRRIVSSMVDKGRSFHHSAISRTVGLPAAMGAKLILQGRVEVKGVRIPTSPDIYVPILEELKAFDIHFHEEEFDLDAEGNVLEKT